MEQTADDKHDNVVRLAHEEAARIRRPIDDIYAALNADCPGSATSDWWTDRLVHWLHEATAWRPPDWLPPEIQGELQTEMVAACHTLARRIIKHRFELRMGGGR